MRERERDRERERERKRERKREGGRRGRGRGRGRERENGEGDSPMEYNGFIRDFQLVSDLVFCLNNYSARLVLTGCQTIS